jgi:PGDYG protein
VLYEYIDRKASALLFSISLAPVFKKQGSVKARKAHAGEKVTTQLADGKKETVNTAQDGDWIVTNPSGERYVIHDRVFKARYSATADACVFTAKGSCRALVNPYGVPIEILASWGTPQTGGADCMIADVCDDDGSNLAGEPYLIDAQAFVETYR